MYSLHAYYFVKNVVLSFGKLIKIVPIKTLAEKCCIERYVRSMKSGY